RNYQPLFPFLDEFDQRGYGGYFHFTLTGYGPPLERCAPAVPKMIDVFKALADRYSPQHVLWRFDPILLSNRTPPDFILATFEQLARQLHGSTERCYVSFVDFYRKTEKNLRLLEEQGVQVSDPPLAAKIELTERLVTLGHNYGIRLYACCEPDLLDIPGLQQAHCVDPLLIQQLFPQKFQRLKAAPTRKGCGCFASRDIGAYDTCVHGCAYCYANSRYEAALRRYRSHDPESPCLGE
ncbi:DUF1848 family protein, partial [candidate division KSB3 bacterium]|nr:DUF1848 family protein [candidate division KSB3 bacterium]